MRLSVDPKDPGYSADAINAGVRIDGVEQSRVITADEEKGEAIRFVANPEGGVMIDPADSTRFLTETIRGKVEIYWPRPELRLPRD